MIGFLIPDSLFSSWQALYLGVRVGAQWDSFGFWNIVGFLFLTFANYVSLSFILSALKVGAPYSYWEDWLLVNMFVQVTSIYSDSFWWFYLVVPGYLAYQFRSTLAGLCGCCGGGQGAEVAVEESEFDRKKREKRERQEEQEKRRFGNRR